jgi:hypothetical protein
VKETFKATGGIFLLLINIGSTFEKLIPIIKKECSRILIRFAAVREKPVEKIKILKTN